jgi:hypothetical protein
MQKHILSKSTYIRGLQCHKSLYLYKHHNKLRDTISARQQAIFNRGTDVGVLARQLFPGGVDASPDTPFQYQESVKQTAKYIASGKKVIYEAAFQFEGVLAAVDILVFENNAWKAYEVKSSTSVSDVYLHDAALQYYVISGSGINIEDFRVVYINNQYTRRGALDINALFTSESVLKKAKNMHQFVENAVQKAKAILIQPNIPETPIGEQCMSPYECDFKGHCWKNIPEKSVFEFAGMQLSRKFELFNQGMVFMKDVPPELLNSGQKIQVTHDTALTHYFDKVAINTFLEKLPYPLYFMDFETMMSAVPLFDKTRPYQQIPFQFSVHYCDSSNSQPEHAEFLADAGSDPREAFILSLISTLNHENALIVTYNQSFEKSCLEALSNAFPEHTTELRSIISRVRDLMDPFRQKQVYFPAMDGSYSIKSVLPAMVPELSYESLEVADGAMAATGFESLQYEKNPEKIAKMRQNLLDYCRLDTLAMVRIFEKLRLLLHA